MTRSAAAVRVRGAIIASCALAFAGSAVAQPILPSTQPPPAATPSTNWTLDIGPGVVWTHRFEGSRERRVLPVPAIELRYRNDLFFISTREGIGSALLDVGGFKAGPILRYGFSRGEGDSVYLRGMGNIPFTVEGGAFVRYDFASFAGARVEVRRGLGGHNGFVAEASVDGRIRFGSVGLSGGPRISLGDSTYNQAFYGVDAVQSARSGYARYDAGFGLRSIGANASALWSITDRITGIAFASYGRLIGPAAGSPIVNGPGGQHDQYTLGAAITYRFAW